MPILKSIPLECQRILLENGFKLDTVYVEVRSVKPVIDGKNDTLSRAKAELSFIAHELTSSLEAFEKEFPELRVGSHIRIDRIDISSSGDPDREIIHRVVIEARLKS